MHSTWAVEEANLKKFSLDQDQIRLRVVSNFGDCDCGAGKIHTRARESSRRRDAKGAPKIRDYRLSPGFWIKRVHSKRKTLIGPFLDTCQQSGNSTQAAVNTHDNIDSVLVYWEGRQITGFSGQISERCSKLHSVRLEIVCPSHSKSC